MANLDFFAAEEDQKAVIGFLFSATDDTLAIRMAGDQRLRQN